MITHKQLKEAQEFYNYGIKEGYINEDDYKFLEDEEFVKAMNELRDKGDMYADQQRKGE